MAVARVEWQCPGCERRFAIRADMETPKLCPQCRAQSGTAAKPGAPGTASARDAAESEFASFPELTPQPPRDVVSPPEIETPSAAPPRKYPALKFLSMFYKVFAVLIALGGVTALVTAVVTAFTVEDTSPLIAGILLQLAGFVGSLFVAVTLYAFGELVQLLIDIEWNTRAAHESTMSQRPPSP